jgi:hypothetical protein
MEKGKVDEVLIVFRIKANCRHSSPLKCILNKFAISSIEAAHCISRYISGELSSELSILNHIF